MYEDQVFPGVVKVLNGAVKVKCMEYETLTQNCFSWSDDIDSILYENDDVICKIDAPSDSGHCTYNKRKQMYTVANSDYEKSCKFINN